MFWPSNGRPTPRRWPASWPRRSAPPRRVPRACGRGVRTEDSEHDRPGDRITVDASNRPFGPGRRKRLTGRYRRRTLACRALGHAGLGYRGLRYRSNYLGPPQDRFGSGLGLSLLQACGQPTCSDSGEYGSDEQEFAAERHDILRTVSRRQVSPAASTVGSGLSRIDRQRTKSEWIPSAIFTPDSGC